MFSTDGSQGPLYPGSNRLGTADVERARAVSIVDLARECGLALKKNGPDFVGACPLCGGRDRFAVHITKNVFHCRGCAKGGDAIAFLRWLDGVGFREAVATLTGQRQPRGIAYAPAPANTARPDRRQRDKAGWLWSQRQPISGSPAEVYLRSRKISCPLPPTLAYLPPRKPGHHPAMIAAFGVCAEIEPGVITAPTDVQAVHLTLLKPDGSGKADTKPDKRMVGAVSGRPIVITPPNDLLGLAITEGIEDALSVHQSTGLGAWAAGSAFHMPKLAAAVPDYIDCVTIFADDNPVGEQNSGLLADRLKARGIHAEVLPLAGVRS